MIFFLVSVKSNIFSTTWKWHFLSNVVPVDYRQESRVCVSPFPVDDGMKRKRVATDTGSVCVFVCVFLED